MKIQRFFIKESIAPEKTVEVFDKDLAHQIRKVFRKREGDIVGLLDNSGKGFEASVSDFGKDSVSFDVSNVSLNCFVPEKELWIYVCIPKKDKFELVVEKATELGVSHIVPVLSERTEKQNINIERIERIIKEASEQSERGKLPVLHESIEIENIPEDICVLHMEGKSFADSGIKEKKIVKVLIGPEGGLGEKDFSVFKEKNIEIVSLGKQVLRAETASIAICSLILLN